MPDPTDSKIWQAAMLKGGFLFGEYFRYRRNFTTEAAEPMAGVASDVFTLYGFAKTEIGTKLKQKA